MAVVFEMAFQELRALDTRNIWIARQLDIAHSVGEIK